MFWRLLVGFAVLTIWAASETRAAEIKAVQTDDPALAIIIVSGELHEGDGDVFATVARRTPRVAGVMFSSPGGALIAGLQIGQLVRLRRYPTVVPQGVVCASACALAWVAGVPRIMQVGARIGFHAAYDRDSHEVTGGGNALVGAYLNRIGLSDEAIYFAAKAAPDEITWLTPAEARRIGMDVRIVPASDTGHVPAEPSAPAARPAVAKPAIPPATETPVFGQTMLPFLTRPEPPPPTATSLAERAETFVGDYFAHWSETADQALTFFAGTYATRVNFYGASLPHGDLLKVKRDYTARWPVRVYAARPDSLRAFCNDANRTCVVTGVVDWDCRSPDRNARSSGAANFSLTVDLAGTREQILAEAGSVISRTVD